MAPVAPPAYSIRISTTTNAQDAEEMDLQPLFQEDQELLSAVDLRSSTAGAKLLQVSISASYAEMEVTGKPLLRPVGSTSRKPRLKTVSSTLETLLESAALAREVLFLQLTVDHALLSHHWLYNLLEEFYKMHLQRTHQLTQPTM